ncbi:baseplate hub protein [Variovorax sp. GT1P44]|uniref:baseplate hub domain-containing protein n=1 Tax=Variovorax sp. GT1P44 TaxID=3443742 RepID=UPI003F4835D9
MSGSRTIPSALLTHLQSNTTSLTVLIKIQPRSPQYAAFGITKLDRDVTYNDGTGSLTYSAAIGMVPAELRSQSSMEVGNSEFKHLLPQFSVLVNEDLIRAGVYDYAWYTVYVVNYEDLTSGRHWIPPAGFGQVGRLSVDDRGLSFMMELTDLAKLLKQSVVENYSLTCRAIFGSQPIGTGGGVVEQKYSCGFDASTLWTATKTVTGVGAESNRTFTASALGLAANICVPGMVKWLTGNNAGRQEMVESQDASGNISTKFELPFPVQVGDTFTIRSDCTKWKDGANGCKAHFGGTEWKRHYRGEPLIKIGDADSNATPGATIGTGSA